MAEKLLEREVLILEDLARFMQINRIKFEAVNEKVMLINERGDVFISKYLSHREIRECLDKNK